MPIALVYSLLTYRVIFWGDSFSCDINMLQVCQNKIVRNLRVFHNKLIWTNWTTYTSKTNLFLQLELLKDIYFYSRPARQCTAQSVVPTYLTHLHQKIMCFSKPSRGRHYNLLCIICSKYSLVVLYDHVLDY